MKILIAAALILAPCALAEPVRLAETIRPLPSPQLRAWRLLAPVAGLNAPALYRVAYRESRFRPEVTNRQSGAAGMMQFLPGTFEHARRGAGLPVTASPYEPRDAVAAASWLWNQPRGSRHWRTHGRR